MSHWSASPRTIRLQARRLPALIGLLLGLQLLLPYRGWTALAVGLAGLWALAYLWARSLARSLRLTRETRFGWTQVGDRLLERFTLTNDGLAPAVWLRLSDHSTLPGLRPDLATHLGSHSTIRWHRETVCTRRGLFTLGPTALEAGDPFGIYRVDIPDASSASLLVLPPVAELPSIRVAAGGSFGDGRPGSATLERAVSSSRATEYRPGHSLRWIHWPTSARQDALFVRLFDRMPSGDWWILLDLLQEVQVGEGSDSTLEHAIILAASLGVRGLERRRPVGLVAQSAQSDWIWLPARAGEAQRWELMQALAQLRPGQTDLDQVLERVARSVARPASLIVISPAVQGGWVPSLLRLTNQGHVPTVLLFDPHSYRGGATRPAGGSGLAADQLARSGIVHYRMDANFLEPTAPQPAASRPRPLLREERWRPLRG